MKRKRVKQTSVEKIVPKMFCGLVLGSSMLLTNHLVSANEISETSVERVESANLANLTDIESEVAAPVEESESTISSSVKASSIPAESAETSVTEDGVSSAEDTTSYETPTITSGSPQESPESQNQAEDETILASSEEEIAEVASQTYSTSALVEPTVQVSQNGVKLDLAYTGEIPQSANILYAVWTEDKNQDDLRWYTANQNGQFSVDLSQYHRSYGLYNIHTYLSNNGSMTGISATRYEVKKPTINMEVIKKSEDEYEVVFSGVTGDISTVQTPIWTEKKVRMI